MRGRGHVLIAGAGIGGLTAAIGLRRAGFEVEVFERAPELKPVGAGIVLAINALMGLRSLGVYERIAMAGAVIHSASILTRKGCTLGETHFEPLMQHFGVAAIAYHRAELHEVLLEEAGKDAIHLGTEVVSFDQSADGVRVRLSNGEYVKGDLLVGADGLHSRVRDSVLGATPLRYAGYTSWRGVTPEGENLVPQGVSTESWGPGRRFGCVGLTRGRTYWFAVDDANPGGRDGGDLREKLRSMFDGWHAPIRELIDATPAEAILRTDINDRDPVEVWGDGRVTLLGDAAHPMTPNLGQGACQAVEDAVALAEELSGALAKNGAIVAALRRYEEKRRPRTRTVVWKSRRLGQIAHWSNPLARVVRDAALWAMPKKETMRQLRDFLMDAPTYRGNGAAPPPP